ncbi:hypothetical protein OH76DRAFT_1400070 [Lentinus brumalis]|uniref:Uncharacterized protein n=1 Tax=Lentinus brumalis TaxID=2498619 RepID=A0A371DJX0_9APHY|nr:hypothetical protein OH76DRAFT_1400070 [Polyporus brumalis]
MSSSHSTNGHTNRLANAKSPDLLQHAKHPVDDIPHPHANMAHLATPDFLASIRALYPSTSSCDPNLWAVVAAVSFGASNVAEAVPLVFTWALDELIQAQHRANTPTDAANAEQLALARRIREALLQSGLLSGMPRAITSLVALHKVMPEHLRETKPLRDTKKSPEECDKRGEELFGAVYRDSAHRVQTLLHSAYPDLGPSFSVLPYHCPTICRWQKHR